MTPQQLTAAVLGFLAVLALVLLTRTSVRRSRHRRYRRRSERLLETIRAEENPARALAYLRKTNPYVFEELLLTCYEHKGMKVIRNRKYSGDGGIDGKVYIDGRLHYLQAKRYSSHVSLRHVEEFTRTCERSHHPGIFIHTGRTGAGIREFLAGHPSVTILSGGRLIDFLKS